MTIYLKICLSLAVAGVFASCSSKIDTKNFDYKAWKLDFNGCDGTREILVPSFNEMKSNLLGITEAQLITILGNANKQELGDRKKKTYFYYIKPGKQCAFRNNETRLLVVDFDALDRVALFSMKVE